MNRHPLSRRAVLRGAGVSVALPLLDAMTAGRAEATAPVRLVTFFWPNGPRGTRWAPSAPTLSAGTLGACMKEAFAPKPGAPDIIPYLNVVTGLGAGDIWKSGHSCAMAAAGYGTASDHNNFGNWPTQATIDQLCAARLGGKTRFPSLVLSAPVGAYMNAPGWSFISWRDGTRSVPPSKNPRDVWKQLFGASGAGGSPDLARALDRRRSLLDFVRKDAESLSARLGAGDRARVDEHLTAIRELEKQLAPATGGVAATCDQASEPTGVASDVAMLKILALAFKCDLTRYASFMLDAAAGNRNYSALGSPGSDHDLSHNGSDDAVIRRTNVKLGYLATFLRDLAATPEAGKTVLDNAIVYSVSDVADGRTHARNPSSNNAGMPVVVAGRAGGALKAGRHVEGRGKRLSDLLCSILNYAGVPHDKYGSNGTGPLPGF